MKNERSRAHVIRRSVALPSSLVEEVETTVAPGLKSNFNRLVILALEEFVSRRKRQRFARSMAEMAADQAVMQESRAISREFFQTESDGLVF